MIVRYASRKFGIRNYELRIRSWDFCLRMKSDALSAGIAESKGVKVNEQD